METHTSLATDVSSRDRWLITALLGLGLITFAIDASNTRLVLPQMMTSLRVELYQSHWVFTAPGIARTVMTASTGWLSGALGPRPLFLLSIGTLTLGALGSLVAWDWPSLLGFRVLAGMGGGMIPPLSQAIFYQIFPPGQRGMALGFALMGWSIGPAFGPLMGARCWRRPLADRVGGDATAEWRGLALGLVVVTAAAPAAGCPRCGAPGGGRVHAAGGPHAGQSRRVGRAIHSDAPGRGRGEGGGLCGRLMVPRGNHRNTPSSRVEMGGLYRVLTPQGFSARYGDTTYHRSSSTRAASIPS